MGCFGECLTFALCCGSARRVISTGHGRSCLPPRSDEADLNPSRTIPDILHGDETRVWGDSAYQGQREAILKAAPRAHDFTHHRGNRVSAFSKKEVAKNHTKSRVRAHVERLFRILKCVFGFRKVCYRGIAKNLNRLQVSFALVNLYTKRRLLMRCVMA
jgi:IS5 family transposase